MRPIQDVLPLLATPKNIFIICHTKPDGDAAGSTLGLKHYLDLKGHQTALIVPSELPDFLHFLPGANQVIDATEQESKAVAALKKAGLIFCLDFNQFSRTKVMEQHLAAATQPKVLIDHHMFPADYWDYGMSEPDKSSTCEMVYDFINLCGDNALINLNIAQCLYTGMMTDTGSFRYSATTGSVHRAVADFLDRGLDQTIIHQQVYDSWSEKRMRFVGYSLIEKMELFPEYKTGLISVSRKDLKLFGLSTGDTEGLVNYPLSIAGVKFAALISERNDEVKLSLRSKGDFDVNAVARTYFNGGGHFNASGGSSKKSLEETIAYFKEILPQIAPR